jgi:hypothetical protein
VRVELVKGQSSLGAWETDAKAAGARVEVGSDPECAWRVVAAGVQPYHVEMYWDGEVLWVADAGDNPSVKVDGMAIDDWCATAHGSRVEFGDAQLRVVTQAVDLSSVVDRTDHGLNNPSLVTRATGIQGEKTQLDSGPRFGDDAPPVYALESGAPKTPSPEDLIVTRMNVSPKRRLDEVAVAKTAIDPPRPSQPIFGGAAAAPNETRLVPLPSGPRPGGAPESPRRAPPPRLGNRGRAVRASSPPKSNGADAQMPMQPQMVQPQMMQPQMMQPQMMQPQMMQPQMMQPQMMQPQMLPNALPNAMPVQHAMQPVPPSMQPSPSPAVAPHAMPTMPMTAPMPPQPMQQANPAFPSAPSDAISAAGAVGTPMQLAPALPPEAPSFTAPPAVVATAKPKKKMSLPPRTWIMLSVTVLAACFVLLMDDGEEIVEEQTTPVVQVAETPETTGASETSMAQPEEPRSLIGLPDTIEVAEPEDPNEAAEIVEEETGDTLARRAADALMSGDHRAAMLLYRELVLLEPENEAYRSIALMIERELRARCRDGIDPNGEPCESP